MEIRRKLGRPDTYALRVRLNRRHHHSAPLKGNRDLGRGSCHVEHHPMDD
jgi:hypothetical protein